MPEKIGLKKDKAIVFMGTMNAMPMMYALELKNRGYEVIYFVDVPKQNSLSRPENHFPEITYPYPPWVVEFVIPSYSLLPLFPRLFANIYKLKVKQLTKKEVGCFVLNGMFASLGPYLPKSASKIGLSHGSDLDVWANTENSKHLSESCPDDSLFRYLPKVLSRRMIMDIVRRQYFGFAAANAVIYFPIGFNAAGDSVVRKLRNDGVKYVPRYDVSYKPLEGQNREFKAPQKTLEIFSGVRFMYRTFPDGNDEYNKGNDIIIEGIAKYYSINKDIKVHFVEKGGDVKYAKELCREKGIEEVVVWHKEMPFKELLALYQRSDICFDQVGRHWIGAVGVYALWLGKPLIANAEATVRLGIWPEDNPICSANSPEKVYEWLRKLENPEFRAAVSEKSREFSETCMGPFHVLDEIFQYE
jgi:glycosyltransferase involved in cell wall biosynthesis